MATSVEIPSKAVEFDLNALHPSGALAFWGCEAISPNMSRERKKLAELEQELTESCFRNRQNVCTSDWAENGEMVAVLDPENRNRWLRGCVKSSFPSIKGVKYNVEMVDRGLTVRVLKPMLKPLPVQDLPHQAKVLSLYGLVPFGIEYDRGADKFRKQTLEDNSPGALAFLDKVLKCYSKAYFVDRQTQFSTRQIRYGDIYLEMERKIVSLSEEICRLGFAVRDEEEFIKRLNSSLAENEEENNLLLTPLPPESSSSCTELSESDSSSGQQSHANMDDVLERQSLQVEKKLVGFENGSTNFQPKKKIVPSSLMKLLAISKKASEIAPSTSTARVREAAPQPQTTKGKTLYIPAGFVQSNTSSPKCEPKPPKRFQIPKPAYDSDSSDAYAPSEAAASSVTGATSIDKFLQNQKALSDTSQSHSESDESSRSRKTAGAESRSSASNSSTENIGSRQKPSTQGVVKWSKAGAEFDSNVCSEKPKLIHGAGSSVAPCIKLSDPKLKLNFELVKTLSKQNWKQLTGIQSYSWPAIKKLRDVVMVSPRHFGRAMGYIVPLVNLLLCENEFPVGNGPIVLILCSGSEKVEILFRKIKKLVASFHSIRVLRVYGTAVDNDTLVDLMNGCEVLITTPPCFLRLFRYQQLENSCVQSQTQSKKSDENESCGDQKDFNESLADLKLNDELRGILVSMRRLQHFVLDDADVTISTFPKQIRDIEIMLNHKSNQDSVQMIVSSEKWLNQIESFVKRILGEPLLIIHDCLEAAIYGRAKIQLKVVPDVKKLQTLVELLRGCNGMEKGVIVCTSRKETVNVCEFLQNACHNVLLIDPNDTTSIKYEGQLSSWENSRPGQHYILVCTDDDLWMLKITDANFLVHFSMPQEIGSYFKDRFGVLLGNLHNSIENKRSQSQAKAYILLDPEKEIAQFPSMVIIKKRLGDSISDEVKEVYERAIDLKERGKRKGKPFCMNLKMFGSCSTALCRNRHELMKEIDAPKDLPISGNVEMLVTAVHSASRYSARLLEVVNTKGERSKVRNKFVTLSIEMFNYLSKKENRFFHASSDIQVGLLCGVETETDLFNRAMVLEIEDKNKRLEPIKIKIRLIDTGVEMSINPQISSLYCLPHDILDVPPQAVDVFACSISPCDSDKSWGNLATLAVKQWTLNAYEKYNKKLTGRIVLSLNGALWLDPVDILKWLPSMKIYVSIRNISRSLLQDQHAIENPEHMPNLYSLCQKGDLASIVPSASTKRRVFISQPKPQWSFLDLEYEEVMLSWADSPSSFFVRKKKFTKLLDSLLNELEKNLEGKGKRIPAVDSGYIYLARFPANKRWYRAQVLSLHDENLVSVFYVDCGERAVISRQDVIDIPEWGISRLPFQAIECSLMGIAPKTEAWEENAGQYLRDVTENGTLSVLLKVCGERVRAEYTGGKRYPVVMIKTEEKILVNKEYVEMGFAIEKEEVTEVFKDVIRNLPDRVTDSTDEEESDLEVEKSIVELKNISNSTMKDHASNTIPEEEEDPDMCVMINGEMINFANFDFCDPEQFFSNIFLNTEEEPSNTIKGSLETPALPAPEQSVPEHREMSPVNQMKKQVSPKKINPSTPTRQRESLMPSLVVARHPDVTWFEDKDTVCIKLCVREDFKVYLRYSSVQLQFCARKDHRLYHFDHILRGTIVPSTAEIKQTGFFVQIIFEKAVKGMLWERLLQSKKKYQWIKLDPDNVVSSSDENDIFDVDNAVKKIPIGKRRKFIGENLHTALPEELSDSDSEEKEKVCYADAGSDDD